MHVVTVVSLFAAALSMISFVPQAWGIIKSRNTDGISLKMYLIIVQNIICLCLSSFILTMRLLPQKEKEAVADSVAAVIPGAEPDRPA